MPTFGKRRALGQHFLKDRKLAQRIAEKSIEQAKKAQCQMILEIGPGKGALTEPLLAEASKERLPLFLVERDRLLAAEWKVKAEKSAGAFQVVEADFVELPENEWLIRSPLGVTSNLPYSAGTAIVTRLARQTQKIGYMLLMFQAEVARRLRAEPDTKSWGSLSVWIQNRWDVTKFESVPPSSFAPPPDVQSEVVLLTPRPEPRVRTDENSRTEQLWESLLRACFAHRRKMLRSSLKSLKPYQNALELSGVDGTKRAEALDWNEWDRLYQALLRSRS